MFTDIDPLEELRIAKHNIGELIKAYTALEHNMQEILHQNRQLRTLNTTNRIEIERLQNRVIKLEEMAKKPQT